jgi:hypothetical protein
MAAATATTTAVDPDRGEVLHDTGRENPIG